MESRLCFTFTLSLLFFLRVFDMVVLMNFFFSNTRAVYHCIKTKEIGTKFGYNPNGTDSIWTQAGKPAEHNPKDKLQHELLTSCTT